MIGPDMAEMLCQSHRFSFCWDKVEIHSLMKKKSIFMKTSVKENSSPILQRTVQSGSMLIAQSKINLMSISNFSKVVFEIMLSSIVLHHNLILLQLKCYWELLLLILQ